MSDFFNSYSSDCLISGNTDLLGLSAEQFFEQPLKAAIVQSPMMCEPNSDLHLLKNASYDITPSSTDNFTLNCVNDDVFATEPQPIFHQNDYDKIGLPDPSEPSSDGMDAIIKTLYDDTIGTDSQISENIALGEVMQVTVPSPATRPDCVYPLTLESAPSSSHDQNFTANQRPAEEKVTVTYRPELFVTFGAHENLSNNVNENHQPQVLKSDAKARAKPSKPSRRRKNACPKPKEYERDEPYSDPAKEKKRLNARKAKANREKQAIKTAKLERDNESLREEVQRLKMIVENLTASQQRNSIHFEKAKAELEKISIFHL